MNHEVNCEHNSEGCTAHTHTKHNTGTSRQPTSSHTLQHLTLHNAQCPQLPPQTSWCTQRQLKVMITLQKKRWINSFCAASSASNVAAPKPYWPLAKGILKVPMQTNVKNSTLQIQTSVCNMTDTNRYFTSCADLKSPHGKPSAITINKDYVTAVSHKQNPDCSQNLCHYYQYQPRVECFDSTIPEPGSCFCWRLVRLLWTKCSIIQHFSWENTLLYLHLQLQLLYLQLHLLDDILSALWCTLSCTCWKTNCHSMPFARPQLHLLEDQLPRYAFCTGPPLGKCKRPLCFLPLLVLLE